MKPLTQFTSEELEQELARREAVKSNYPEANPNPDWSPLVRDLKEVVESIASKGYNDEDNKQYIYETAMKCLYGEGVWVWIRTVLR